MPVFKEKTSKQKQLILLSKHDSEIFITTIDGLIHFA